MRDERDAYARKGVGGGGLEPPHPCGEFVTTARDATKSSGSEEGKKVRITEYPSILFRLSRSREYLPQLLSIFLLVAQISPQSLLSYRTIIVFLANLFLTAFTYTINNVEDAEDDYQDFKKRNRNLIFNGTIGKGWGYMRARNISFVFATFLMLTVIVSNPPSFIIYTIESTISLSCKCIHLLTKAQ